MENEDKDDEDEEIEGILKEFDYDGDKTISKQEFINFFLKLKEAQRMKDEAKIEVDRKVWYLYNKLNFFVSVFKFIYRFRI